MADEHVFDEPEPDVPTGDSGVLNPAPVPEGLMKVYETGELTVVGFGGCDVPNEVTLAGYREHLYQLIDTHECQTVAFDLTGVKRMPSGMLGLLASVKNRGLDVELFNASEDVREVLQTTRLADFFDLRDVDVGEGEQ